MHYHLKMPPNASIITIEKEGFPEALAQMADPPERLYARGTWPLPDHKRLCVVGARRFSGYGKEVCETLVRSLVGLPVSIVSGLAIGIDEIAHKTALEVGLTAIAVPGSGIDDNVLYPSRNRPLARDILKSHGTLLSEFAPKQMAAPWTFPQRNRIMAGLSDAVLVIEAELRSGTLITSRLASDYNRDVLTVPGSVFSPLSAGPHMLLKLGATPITSGDDLKAALGFEIAESVQDFGELSDEERQVIRMLHSPLSRDEVLRNFGRPISETMALLSSMELKGLIVERGSELHAALGLSRDQR